MYTARTFRFLPALRWTSSVIVLTSIWSSSVVLLYHTYQQRWLSLPITPVSILGTAVAFYLGFKGNAAYGRLWEARIIWGGIVNSSRTFAAHARDMITDLRVADPTGCPPSRTCIASSCIGTSRGSTRSARSCAD